MLGFLLVADLLMALVVSWKVPFMSPTIEYLYPALEYAAKHRIASDFLPVGLSGLLGIGAMMPRQTVGMTAVLILISLALIVAAWVYLRALGMGVRATFYLTTLLSVYPDFLLSYDKLLDVNLTAFFLFALMAAILWVLRSKRVGVADVVLGLGLGAAVVARTNLALMLPLIWFLLWKFRVAGRLVRSGMYLGLAVVVFAGLTTVIHGRPFVPHNGPYNLYAGANELTGAHLANEEDTLTPMLARHGIDATLQWSGAPNPAGFMDLRDPRLSQVYRALAWQYIKAHPGTMMELAGLKLLTLLRPDFRRYSARSVGGLLKIVASLGFPLWLAGMVWWRHPEPAVGPAAAKWMVGLLVVLYLLPFALTVSPPHFGVPLEFVCWMDLGAMVVSRYRLGLGSD
jgi:hypothetical protein